MLLFAVAVVAAQLPQLTEPALQQTAVRTETLLGGGEARVAKPDVVLSQASLAPANDRALMVNLRQSGATLEATSRALGLPANWREYDRLAVLLGIDHPAQVEITVLLPRGRLATAQTLSMNTPTEIVLPLDDLPLAAGSQPLYEPNGLRIGCTWTNGEPTRALTITSVTLLPRAGAAPPVVDPFGQRRSTDWPGKIHRIGELRQRTDEEGAQLARVTQENKQGEPLDRFGGWRAGPIFRASGFFRTEQESGGTWWLVTPDGHPFWSIGTTGVRVGSVNDTARAVGREFLFEALPSPTGPAWFAGRQTNTLGDVEVAGNVHFYRWNVLRKYRSFEAWRDRVLARWPAWGLNSFGAWSDELVLRQETIPHTRFLRARAAVPGVPATNDFPDVWDERWSAWVDAEFARETAVERGNPWLIGYFVDNEAHWSDLRLLDIAPDARLRDVWRDFVRDRYESLEKFNADWGTTFASWDDARALKAAAVPPKGSAAREAMTAFEGLYAERYFATVARLLRRHDPDHLYLGCRFVRTPPAPVIVAAAGRHVDVLSVNCYSRIPAPAAFLEWHRLSGGRPILIGEFDFPLESPRQIPPPWQAFPEAEREQMFIEFVRTWAQQPWAVGCHWYQHADQPVTGRHTDGENQTVGFVDVTDTPYDHLVRAARAATAKMYHWHRDARAPTPDGTGTTR